ncbi:hypothetical protein [Collimonas sp.]|jgi:hypothetical protein|uniref:hypothetical protein n=1 Tax=Collimonas sp. TaxID=1963772 RepID=UPI002B74BD95|nr:hypothetical protein [Collimonas sp.]HWW99514.1 hypothetical protein [Collimonas sp.]
MKEIPILYTGAMVRALLADDKTQTRRTCKLQPHVGSGMTWWPDGKGTDTGTSGGAPGCYLDLCPFGQPGDRHWVRETWQHSNWPHGPFDEDCDIFYRADYMDDPHGPDGELSPEGKYRTWRPSIHMPRAASRIMLEVMNVRVERLQDISEADAFAEGVSALNSRHAGAAYVTDVRLAYELLWKSLYGAGSWDANPWVWVVKFRRVTEQVQ